MLKSVVMASVLMLSSVGFASQTKVCSFEGMVAPMKVSFEAKKAVIAVPGSKDVPCVAAESEEVTQLNKDLVKKGEKMGPYSQVYRCKDGVSGSSAELFLTNTSKAQIYLDGAGLYAGECK